MGNLLLGHKFLGESLALFADSNSSVGVVHELLKLILLDDLSVEGLEGNEVGHAEGKGGNESNESASLLQILLVLLVGDVSIRGREHGEWRVVVLKSALLLFLELVGGFGKNGHGDVVGSTH